MYNRHSLGVPVNLFSLQALHLSADGLLALCRPLHKDKNSWCFLVWVGDRGVVTYMGRQPTQLTGRTVCVSCPKISASWLEVLCRGYLHPLSRVLNREAGNVSLFSYRSHL